MFFLLSSRASVYFVNVSLTCIRVAIAVTKNTQAHYIYIYINEFEPWQTVARRLVQTRAKMKHKWTGAPFRPAPVLVHREKSSSMSVDHPMNVNVLNNEFLFETRKRPSQEKGGEVERERERENDGKRKTNELVGSKMTRRDASGRLCHVFRLRANRNENRLNRIFLTVQSKKRISRTV